VCPCLSSTRRWTRRNSRSLHCAIIFAFLPITSNQMKWPSSNLLQNNGSLVACLHSNEQEPEHLERRKPWLSLARVTQDHHNAMKGRRHLPSFLTAMLMKTSITPRSPLKVNRRFGRTCRLYVLDRRISQTRNERFHKLALLDICFKYISPQRRLIFSGLHGVTNKQKNKLRGLSPQARTIPTERPPLVGEVSANFSG
jgi:hypothetical protein